MYTNERDIDFDKEYLPTLNTKRFEGIENPTDTILAKFAEVTGNETKKVRQKYKVRQDVRYAGVDDNQILDIYYKEVENDTPIFAFIHGGYWQLLDKNTSGSFVGPLVENNYRVVVMDYNLCPTVTLQQLTQQIWNFYEWLFKYAKETNSSKITVCGHSAGGHLASILLDEKLLSSPHSDRLTSLYLISGVYDLRELWSLECANPKNILSLNSVKEAAELSPLCWIIKQDLIEFCNKIGLKIYVVIPEYESVTFSEQSRAYAKKLAEAGLKASFKFFEKYDHFDIIEEAANKDSVISRYILNNL